MSWKWCLGVFKDSIRSIWWKIMVHHSFIFAFVPSSFEKKDIQISKWEMKYIQINLVSDGKYNSNFTFFVLEEKLQSIPSNTCNALKHDLIISQKINEC